MTPTRPAVTRRAPRAAALLLAMLATLIALLAFTAAPASADEVDTDKYPNRVSGNVQLNGAPLPGIELTVSGNGVDTKVVTDADGKWAVGVPEKNADYVVTLNEETLPDGIAVVDEADDTPNQKEVTVGPGGRVSVNFFIGQGERTTVGFADRLIAGLITGVRFGLMLALAAVGLSLVFGTTGLSNFAHAEMVTFGGIAALLLSQAGVPILVAVILAVALSALFGLAMDVGLWRPLRRRRLGIVQLMIVSIGLSLALRYVFQFIIGGGTSQLPGADARPIQLFGQVALTPIDIISLAISIVVIIAFALWLLFTRVGKATRAISDNAALAAASGIDVDRVVRIVWIMAAGLAGLSGVLYAYYRPGIKWDMGSGFLLLLFAAVTLGGLGTAFGALVGALIIGVIVEVSPVLGMPPDLKFAAPLIVLIVILLFRPQGILGRRERIG